MYSKIKQCISHILDIFKKEPNYLSSNIDLSFFTDTPCNFSDIDNRKVHTHDWHYGDDEYHKICFRASRKEYDCLKQHMEGLSPEEIWNLNDNDEEKEELFWLLLASQYKEDDPETEIITEDNIRQMSIEFICENVRGSFIDCNESVQICFERTSSINGYSFMCFDNDEVCYFSFYS